MTITRWDPRRFIISLNDPGIPAYKQREKMGKTGEKNTIRKRDATYKPKKMWQPWQMQQPRVMRTEREAALKYGEKKCNTARRTCPSKRISSS